jgi:hypothetical protein
VRNAYRVVARKPKGKRTFGRPRYRWDDIIKINVNRNILR